MIKLQMIKTADGLNFVYGVEGDCGETHYSLNAVSVQRSHAEIIDNILSSTKIPEQLIAAIAAGVEEALEEQK